MILMQQNHNTKLNSGFGGSARTGKKKHWQALLNQHEDIPETGLITSSGRMKTQPSIQRSLRRLQKPSFPASRQASRGSASWHPLSGIQGSCVGPSVEHVPQTALGTGLPGQQAYDMMRLPSLGGASTSPESALLRLGEASTQFDLAGPTGPLSSEFDHPMLFGSSFDFNNHANCEQQLAFFEAGGHDMLGLDLNPEFESDWQIRATSQTSPLGTGLTRRPSPISQSQLFLDVDQFFGLNLEQAQPENYIFPPAATMSSPSDLGRFSTNTRFPSQNGTLKDMISNIWHPNLVHDQVRFPAGSTKQWLKSLPFATFDDYLRSRDITFTNKKSCTHQGLGGSLSRSFALTSFENSLFSGSRAIGQRLSGSQNLFQTLGRLLPGESTAVISEQQMTETRLIKLLLFSMINGFIGLQQIPIENILKAIDHFSTSKLLLQILEKGPPFTSRTLADNIFRTAIEAKNEGVVKLLLERKLVDVNDTVCFFRNRRYTPVERAASIRALGLVIILVEANADVNKTYSHGEIVGGSCGALDNLLRATYSGPLSSVTPTIPVIVDTLDFLIRKGSKVGLGLLQASLNYNAPNEVLCLISRCIPMTDHEAFFESEEEVVEERERNSTLLCQTAAKRDDITALTIFQNFLNLCERSGCSKCLERWPQAVRYAAILGAERGHIKLVQLLIGYVTSTTRILSAAIRSGNTRLIKMVLDVDPKPELDPPAHWMRMEHGERLLTTPLAEAVRTRNADLIKVLEIAGALNNLAEGNRLEPLILAAAKAGNMHYIEILLKRASSSSHKYRITWRAVELAIENGHDEVAKMLLSAGAKFVSGARYPGPTICGALHQALRKRDPELVRSLLSADIGRIDHEKIPNNVDSWFDTSILSDLTFMFPDLPLKLAGQPLPVMVSGAPRYPTVHNICIECIKTENLEFFRTFLESVSKTHAFPWNLCLASAIRMGHREMVELLLQYGANPFDAEVLRAAIPDQKDMLQFLFGEDRKQRSGRKCVGAYTLKFAIDNAEVLGSLIENGLVNFIVAEDPIVDPNLGGSYMNDRLTPLGLAIIGLSGFCESNIGAVELLLRAGSDPNGIARIKVVGTRIGQTAIMLALETGSEDLVRLLVDYGADVNKKTHLFIKRTPLQYAAELGNLDMVQLLLEHGAEVNGEPASWSGGTALQFAAISGNCNVAAELLEKGAQLYAPPSKDLKDDIVLGPWTLHGAMGI
ncbi:ankyrin [Hyaloscypha hepaticicola]|uniref:Ankyrin n=1 Tax=Hyaloscypha hepaticicola TaxID=2082293 RepID=A0A2J6QLJ5_9HELO|nr:ankyrin [Hyaloscypha hepaticicola]